MDEILKQIKQDTKEKESNALIFADDVVIWREEQKETQEKLNLWNRMFRSFGMKISKNKTVVMSCSKKDTRMKIELEGEQLENVDQFKYLGSSVDKNNHAFIEINNRIAQATNFYHQVRQLLWNEKVFCYTKILVKINF